MGAIVLGVWATIFMISFTYGMVSSYVDNAIENQISHIQVHVPDFTKDQEYQYYFENPEHLLAEAKMVEGYRAATVRTLIKGAFSTSKGMRGIEIRGVIPAEEANVTKLDQKLVDGKYFQEEGKNQCLVSQRIADKLGVKVRSKIVLTFQDLQGQVTAGAFRVVGIFDTGNAPFDNGNVFVKEADLNRLLGEENIAHEMALILNDPRQVGAAKAFLQQELPDFKVETYREISPDVQLYESQIQNSVNIFIVIIMLALVFGIINTMLMAVLERYRELGMLMAIGMNKVRVFLMIFLETIFLALVAFIPGLLLGYLSVNYFNVYGINLSAFSKGLEQFGMSKMVYPTLEQGVYLQMAIAVAITGILASIYPAWKAINLKPVDAIRKI
ncbi:MAG: ABC transporter permease [Saprospiraceae bacterium]|nr:MAG: ABC transporter permease [Saprospiraceae bacterium]